MIQVLQENLKTALNTVKSMIPNRYQLPILKNVLIESNYCMVKLTVTDMESIIQCEVEGKIDDQFSFTVPCKFMADMVNLLPNDVINIILHNKIATFKSGRYTANLNTLDSVDYPPVPEITGREFEIYNLSDAIKNVKDLIESEKYGYSQTDGLLFDMGLCQVVATDCKRMKVAHINATPIDGLKFRISKKAATILLKFKDTVKITYQPGKKERYSGYIENSRIKFVSGNTTLITENLEARKSYPDYMKVVTDETYKDKVEVF